MQGKLTVIVLAAAALGGASTALAAGGSPPVPGGHYKGSDDSKTFYKTSNSVNITVAKNGKNFAQGRLNFVLQGQGGLGSCAGPAFITLSPTKARQISSTGSFNLTGHFTFAAKTPYGPVEYKATARIKGGFTSAGKHVAGTFTDTAVGKHLTCRSGTVHYAAHLVK